MTNTDEEVKGLYIGIGIAIGFITGCIFMVIIGSWSDYQIRVDTCKSVVAITDDAKVLEYCKVMTSK